MLVLIARSLAFYAGYVSFTVFWATLSLAVAWAMPPQGRFDFVIGRWTRAVLAWLKVTCAVNVRVTGIDRLPHGSCIFFVKHQSTWETLWVQTLVSPQTTLVKRELLRIPLWGWAFSLTNPIAIDRNNPRGALKQFIEQGQERLQRGVTVTLFPEGTRLAPGERRPFQRGGAALAAATGTPVVVIAHNAGRCWPARRFIKRPGMIDVTISEPFHTSGIKSSEINKLCENWLCKEMARLELDVQVDHR